MEPTDDPLMHGPACSRGRTAGRRLDVQPDYGAFPVWGWFTLPARGGRPAREVHGGIGPRALGLSDELASALQGWSDRQNELQEGLVPAATAEDWRAWQERGQALADELAEQTSATVVYLWPSGGRDPDCPECGTAGQSRIRSATSSGSPGE